MTSPLQAQRVYQELADWYERQAQTQLRDRFLLLAADAALAAGQDADAEHLRQRLLERSPHHMVKPFTSFADALRSPDVQGYINDLRQSYPPETAEQLLQTLHGGQPASAPPAPVPPTVQQPSMLTMPPAAPAAPRPAPQPRAREPLRVFRVQEEEPPPAAPAAPRPAPPQQRPAAARGASAVPAPEPPPARPRPAAAAPQPKTTAPPIPVAQPEPVARSAPPPPVAVPVRRPAPPVGSAIPLRETVPPPPPPRPEPVLVEPRVPAPPRLPSRPPVRPQPARPAEPQLPREPTGSWVSGSLFVLVLLAGTALAAYTLARPFLPPEWLP